MARTAVTPPTAFPAVVFGSLLALLAGCTGVAASGSPNPGVTMSPSAASDVESTPTSSEIIDSTSTPVPVRLPVQLTPAGIVAENLEAPWGIALLPDGSALVAERDSGKINLIRASPAKPAESTEPVQPEPVVEVGTVEGVEAQGEGGLLGLAVSPTYEADQTIFVYFTGADGNQVDRLTYADGAVSEQQPILTGIPAGNTHNGGRIIFGPDGNLYVGTGDAGKRENAQDLTSLAGKILRIAPDGTAPDGNPFPDAPLVYSLGHRNVQGITFDEAGRMWAAEFGPSSVDELNLIVPGDNYGWPLVEGIAGDPAYVDPERVWPTSEASPSGIAFAMGSLWMAGLGGETLWEIPVLDDGTTEEPIAHLSEEFGRLRTVLVAPDKSLWVSTSNTDGRGDPSDVDDRILRFTLS